MKCCYCDNDLNEIEASIPESLICYPAGSPDLKVPGNRLVKEWACPIHGVIMSPGGGISVKAVLVGGPWDGRIVTWGAGPHNIIFNGEEWRYEWNKGEMVEDKKFKGRFLSIYVCKGKVPTASTEA